MTDDSERSIHLTRLSHGRYRATNTKGAAIEVGSGQDDLLSPVELLLAAIAGCGAADVDFVTSRRSEPTRFDVLMTGTKLRDDAGNRLRELRLTFDIRFPDDQAGAAALAVLPDIVAKSHDRLCTVSRTVELGTPIAVKVVQPGDEPT